MNLRHEKSRSRPRSMKYVRRLVMGSFVVAVVYTARVNAVEPLDDAFDDGPYEIDSAEKLYDRHLGYTDSAALARVMARRKAKSLAERSTSRKSALHGPNSDDEETDEAIPESVVDEPDWTENPRVVLHSAESGLAASDQILRQLATTGDYTLERRRVELDIAASHVRYFHYEDRSAALAVASSLSSSEQTIEIRDFTHYTPEPQPGLIEIWVE